MIGKTKKLFKRILSAACAASMFTSSFAMLPAYSEDPDYAHTVPVFDIDVKTGADYDPSTGKYIWEADDAASGHKFVYNIKFSISGEGAEVRDTSGMSPDEIARYEAARDAASEEGFVELRIPAHILKFRGQTKAGVAVDGVFPDEIEMPVPEYSQVPYKIDENGNKVYSADHQFVYRLDDHGTPDNETDDEYVIYNIQGVNAGVVYELPIAYVMNKNTWEYEDLALSDPCGAKLKVESWDETYGPAHKLPINKQTREIPVCIDTTAELTKQTKSATQTVLSPSEVQKKIGIDGLDENYRYTIWSITSEISNVTQKYNFTLTDTPAALTGKDAENQNYTIPGEVVAVNVGSGWDTSPATVNAVTDTTPAGGVTVSNLTASGKRVDYVLTRYRYTPAYENDHNCIKYIEETAPRDSSFSATNNAEGTLKPVDETDPVNENSSAGFKLVYKLPNIPPIAEKYSAEKWGLYNNSSKTVANKNNVSSYELMKLLEDEAIDGLQYRTKTTAHAYGRTIENLEAMLTAIKAPNTPDDDGNVTLNGGSRKYDFNVNETSKYTLTVYEDSTGSTPEAGYPVEMSVPAPYSEKDELSIDDMLQITAADLLDNFYGQQSLKYVLEDKTVDLADVATKESTLPLTPGDYSIDSVGFTYKIKNVKYDSENIEFTEGKENEDYSDNDEYNKLYFSAYIDGSDEKTPVGWYNVENGDSDFDPSLVKSLNDSKLTFADDAHVTGYTIETENKYYYIELISNPSITLYPTDAVKEKVNAVTDAGDPDRKLEDKIALKNTAEWNVYHSSENASLYNKTISGIDYIADIVRESSISKKALGEKVTVKGQDGKTYKSSNDTLNNQYVLAWQINVSETANGVEVNGQILDNQPVAQQSGTFYDLLPAHCDIIEGSVNVYADLSGDPTVDSKPLSPTQFTVYPREDDYDGSGKKLLRIDINAPCAKKYTVTYVTVHTHEDIQDFGSVALNSVAYQTGNSDIGGGYPDNGGNHAISMSEYMKDLDENNNGAKRFIYAESTEDILALFPTSSGIYKKVATSSDPTYGKTASVSSNDTYTYNIRMRNDSATKAFDIAILDSVENFRTHGGVRYNYGGNFDRGWHGTIKAFDLSSVYSKMKEFDDTNGTHTADNDLSLMLYVGSGEDDIVDFNGDAYSDGGARKYLLSTIIGDEKAVDEALYDAALPLLKAYVHYEDMPPEDKADFDENHKETYAAKLAEYKAAIKANLDTVFAPTFEKWKVVDWTTLKTIDTGEDVNMKKVSAFIVYTGGKFILPKGDSLSFTVKMTTPDPEDVPVNEAALASGSYLPYPTTYNNIFRSFKSIPDSATTTQNTTYFYTHYDHTEVKYHVVGELKFKKTDTNTGEGIPGIQFRLTGTSDYGTEYDETLYSDASGFVTFMNLERGTYRLTETVSDEDHILDTTEKTVKVDPEGEFTFLTVDDKVYSVTEGGVTDWGMNNDARYHGEFEFYKNDSLSNNGIAGAKFRLTGISDHNTTYDLEAWSDASGKVSFGDIERGTYTLTEVTTPDGYLPPSNNVFTVTGTGEGDVMFSISGENVTTDNEYYYIKNEPLGEMTLQKADSITKDMLGDAKFTLTAESDLNATLTRLTEEFAGTNWVKNGNVWTQTVDSSNTAVNGGYFFNYLPKGTYTLTEDRAPNGYAADTNSYTVEVVESQDGKKLVIKLPEEYTDPEPDTVPRKMEYIILEDGEFKRTDNKDDALYQRLYNDQSFDDGKTLIKSWVGGVGSSFPSMHLSTEKPEASAVKVTINGSLKTYLNNNRNNIKGFERTNTKPTGSETGYTDCTTTGISGEDGHFCFWNDNGVIKWWSDADIIYLPSNSSFLFYGLNNNNIEIDLSDFNFSKVTSMEGMFASTISIDGKTEVYSKIKKITFPSNIDTSNVTNMDGVFWGCKELTTLDLTGFDTAKVTSMQYMFKFCKNLEEIKLDPKKFTDDSLTSVYRMFDVCEALKQIDLRGFKGEKLDKAQSWFANCRKLEWIDLSNFNGGSTINNINWIFQYLGYGLPNTTGCAIFSNKWNLKENIANKTEPLNYAKLNLYGTIYNPVTDYNKANFDIATPAEGGGTTSLSGGKVNRYFNDPNGDYYTEVFDEEYRNLYTTTAVTEPTDSPAADTFENYPHFTKKGSVTQTENTTATADDVGKKTITFEYETKSVAVPSGVSTYYVDETIFLFVNEIVEENGTYYTVTQKYKYDEVVKAHWTEVGGTAPTQWKCEMQVFKADDEFFAWEDAVDNFEASNTQNNPLFTNSSEDKVIITNSTDDVALGGIRLLKTIDDSKFKDEYFWFKVTMYKENGETPYTLEPFDSNGVAYFKVKANELDENKQIVINGIPENYKYTVEEVRDTTGDHANPEGYAYVSGEVTSDNKGTIVKDTLNKVEIKNTVLTADLSLTKDIEFSKIVNGVLTPITDPDSDDSDYKKWKNTDFKFSLTFKDLIAGKAYTYKINGVDAGTITGSSDSSITTATITLHGGDTLTISGLPQDTEYTVTEDSSGFVNTDTDTYNVSWEITGGNEDSANDVYTLTKTLGSTNDDITFTNSLEYNRPETVDVTIKKKWYLKDGETEVSWKRNASGKVVKWSYNEDTHEWYEDDEGSYVTIRNDTNEIFESSYPSFLKVYIGRALKYVSGGQTLYLDAETSYTSESLQAKKDWQFTFEDLPKYGSMVLNSETVVLPYVYFVSEIVPIGFENNNAADEATAISTSYGTDNFFVATGSENEPEFTLKNKAIPTYELNITKEVTGNLGNRYEEFNFEINFYNKDGTPLTGTGLVAIFTDENGNVERNRTYSLDTSKPLPVSLAHGKTVSFKSVPRDTLYTIREKDTGDYVTSIHRVSGDSPYTLGIDETSEETVAGTVLEKETLASDTNIVFTNDRNADIPTGVAVPAAGAAAAAAIALSGCMIVRKKKRLRKDKD